eukprot:scaffold9.g3111.t1
MASGGGDDAVCVAVHMRPLVDKELDEGCLPCLTVTPGEPQARLGQGQHMFTYDHVFGEGAEPPSQLYDTCVAPLVEGLFKGYNATVFAYGQTGSGKTYTMGSAFAAGGPSRGVIPQVMDAIFARVAACAGTVDFTVRVGFVEIHKEEIKDLLVADPRHPPIHIREVGGGICLAGATEREVRAREEMEAVLQQGSLLRATAATGMNRHSSRSHAIFTITLEQRRVAELGGGAADRPRHHCSSSSKAGGPGEESEGEEDEDSESESGGDEGDDADLPDDSYLCAKMHLVDLAGSERAKRTKAVGARLKEGININRGLLALGNVINALSEGKPHVPYRDSKLTRMLQARQCARCLARRARLCPALPAPGLHDSLGGNSRTLMVACVSPADSNLEESLNTLRYAARARAIRNKPVVNRDPVAAAIAQLRSQLAAARAENLSLKRRLGEAGEGGGAHPAAGLGDEALQAALDEAAARAHRLERDNNRLRVELEAAKGEAAEATRRMVGAQAAAARMQQRLAAADPAAAAAAAEAEGAEGPGSGDVIEDQLLRIAELEREVKRLKQGARAGALAAAGVSRRASLGVPLGGGAAADGLLPGSPFSGAAYSPFKAGLGVLYKHPSGSNSPGIDDDALSEYSTAEDLELEKQHRAGMAELQSKMAALEAQLSAKQSALSTASQHQVLRQAFEGQLKELQKERDELEHERSQLMAQLRAAQAAGEEERHRLQNQYRAKLKELDQKVQHNRARERKLAELEAYKRRAEEGCRKLEAEILSIKQQKVALSKQMERQGKEFAEWRRERDREVAALRKQGRANAKMEALHAKQQAVLKRKTQEAEAARRRLKELELRRDRAAAAAAAAATAAASGAALSARDHRPPTAPGSGAARAAAGAGAGADRPSVSAPGPVREGREGRDSVEVQPNPSAPLLRDERARQRWVEQELEACCASYELQKVLEGEKALRAEAAKQLQGAERKLAALRNPDWWPSAPGAKPGGSPSQPSEERLLQQKAKLQEEMEARSKSIQELQLQLMRAKQSEEERGGGAADARRWAGLRNAAEARALLKTVFRVASQQKAQAYEAQLQLGEAVDDLEMARLHLQVAVAEKFEAEKQLAEAQALLLASQAAVAAGGGDAGAPEATPLPLGASRLGDSALAAAHEKASGSACTPTPPQGAGSSPCGPRPCAAAACEHCWSASHCSDWAPLQDAAEEVLEIVAGYERLQAAPTPATSPSKQSELGPDASALSMQPVRADGPDEEPDDDEEARHHVQLFSAHEWRGSGGRSVIEDDPCHCPPLVQEDEEEDSEDDSHYSSTSSDDEGDVWDESMATPARGRRRPASGTGMARRCSGGGSLPPEEAPVLQDVNAERARAGLPPISKLTVSVLRQHLRGKVVDGRSWVAGKKKRGELVRDCRRLLGLPEVVAGSGAVPGGGSAAAAAGPAPAAGGAPAASSSAPTGSRFLAHTFSSRARSRTAPSGDGGVSVVGHSVPATASASGPADAQDGAAGFGSPLVPELATAARVPPGSAGDGSSGVTPVGAQGLTPDVSLPGTAAAAAGGASPRSRSTSAASVSSPVESPRSSGKGVGSLLRRSFSLRPFGSPRSSLRAASPPPAATSPAVPVSPRQVAPQQPQQDEAADAPASPTHHTALPWETWQAHQSWRPMGETSPRLQQKGEAAASLATGVQPAPPPRAAAPAAAPLSAPSSQQSPSSRLKRLLGLTRSKAGGGSASPALAAADVTPDAPRDRAPPPAHQQQQAPGTNPLRSSNGSMSASGSACQSREGSWGVQEERASLDGGASENEAAPVTTAAATLGAGGKGRPRGSGAGSSSPDSPSEPSSGGGDDEEGDEEAYEPSEEENASGDGSEQEGDTGEEDAADEAPRARVRFFKGGGRAHRSRRSWHKYVGVVKDKSSKREWQVYRADIVLEPGQPPVRLGRFRSCRAATRVSDRANIALLGPQAALRAGRLNHPLSDYPLDRQLWGDDLVEFLCSLQNAYRAWVLHQEWSDASDGEEEAEEGRGDTAVQAEHQGADRGDAMGRGSASGASEEEEPPNPLFCPPYEACGICPSCRQVWLPASAREQCWRLAATARQRQAQAATQKAARAKARQRQKEEKQRQQEQWQVEGEGGDEQQRHVEGEGEEEGQRWQQEGEEAPAQQAPAQHGPLRQARSKQQMREKAADQAARRWEALPLREKQAARAAAEQEKAAQRQQLEDNEVAHAEEVVRRHKELAAAAVASAMEGGAVAAESPPVQQLPSMPPTRLVWLGAPEPGWLPLQQSFSHARAGGASRGRGQGRGSSSRRVFGRGRGAAGREETFAWRSMNQLMLKAEKQAVERALRAESMTAEELRHWALRKQEEARAQRAEAALRGAVPAADSSQQQQRRAGASAEGKPVSQRARQTASQGWWQDEDEEATASEVAEQSSADGVQQSTRSRRRGGSSDGADCTGRAAAEEEEGSPQGAEAEDGAGVEAAAEEAQGRAWWHDAPPAGLDRQREAPQRGRDLVVKQELAPHEGLLSAAQLASLAGLGVPERMLGSLGFDPLSTAKRGAGAGSLAGAAAQAAEQRPSTPRAWAPCRLCGQQRHLSPTDCPVVQAVFAVEIPEHPACERCAERGHDPPCCELCCPELAEGRATWSSPKRGSSPAAARLPPPDARALRQHEAPWLEAVPPATRDVMAAVQGAASAMASQFGLRLLQCSMSPAALLAFGLLAEEAAKGEIFLRSLPEEQSSEPFQPLLPAPPALPPSQHAPEQPADGAGTGRARGRRRGRAGSPVLPDSSPDSAGAEKGKERRAAAKRWQPLPPARERLAEGWARRLEGWLVPAVDTMAVWAVAVGELRTCGECGPCRKRRHYECKVCKALGIRPTDAWRLDHLLGGDGGLATPIADGADSLNKMLTWDSPATDANEPAALEIQLARHGALARTSAQEPYFVTKNKRAQGDGAEVAQLRKKSAVLGREFEVRQLRVDGEAKDKQLDLARRTVERLTGEKAALESTAAADKALIRKLESRLLAAKGAVDLQAKCSDLRSQLDVAVHRLSEAEARAHSAEEAAQHLERDVALLQRGIELAAEQLTRAAGVEVPTTLLMAVARGQEEAMALSVQLADAHQQVGQMAAALEQAKAHLQQQQQLVAQREQQCSELAQRAEGAEAALRRERAAAGELRRALDALRPKAAALAEERDSLLHQEHARRLEKKGKAQEAVGVALREELHRVLAGGSPPPRTTPHRPHGEQQQQRSAAASPPAARARHAGSGGRTTQPQQQQAAAPLPAKTRHASRRRHQGEPPIKASGSPLGLWDLPHGSDQSGSPRIAAEPSPTRALQRLQEQRRQRQGSRLGGAPDGAESQHHLEQGRHLLGHHAAPVPLVDEEGRQHCTLPPAPVARPSSAPQAAAVLPVQDRRLMSLYASALDEQIAVLEADLAQIAGEPSPITRLQVAARAAAAAQAAAAAPAGSGGAGSNGAGTGMDAAEAGTWRPNAAYQQQAVGPGAADRSGLGTLQSPGWDGGDQGARPVWRNNPLHGTRPATSPTRHALGTAAALPAPAEHAAEPATELATPLTCASGSAAAPRAQAPAPGAEGEVEYAVPAGESVGLGRAPQRRVGSSLWQAHSGSKGSSASSPGPKPPRGAPAAAQRMAGQTEEQQQSCSSEASLAAGVAHRQPHQEQQPQRGGQRRPACPHQAEGSEGVAASLSTSWSLPDMVPAGSDWLSSHCEPDIELLEVNSSVKASRQAGRHAARSGCSGGAPELELRQPQFGAAAPAPASPRPLPQALPGRPGGASVPQGERREGRQLGWEELFDDGYATDGSGETGSSGGEWAASLGASPEQGVAPGEADEQTAALLAHAGVAQQQPQGALASGTSPPLGSTLFDIAHAPLPI